MVHQTLILEKVLTDIGQVVRETLTTGKQLPIAAQTGFEGMAAGIDDLGIGQDQMHKSQVREVVRHLVDEAGRPFGTV